MFEHFNFSKNQIDKYLHSAIRDLNIAKGADLTEVSFRFCYDALSKLSIAVCAFKGFRVKARKGHHIELIRKLSIYLNDPDIEALGNEMRSKRNRDLYSGGVLITKKEAVEYLKWTKMIFDKSEKLLNSKIQKFEF